MGHAFGRGDGSRNSYTHLLSWRLVDDKSMNLVAMAEVCIQISENDRISQSERFEIIINLIITGKGGQGIITASKTILQAAVNRGYRVRSAETIGMSQRGGSVSSHVRIGKEIDSPFISLGQADEIIALDRLEALRFKKYMKRGGHIYTAVYEKDREKKDGESDSVLDINLTYACEKLGTRKMSNIIMLGMIFSRNNYPISIKDIEEVILKYYPSDSGQKNVQALYMGQALMEKMRYEG